MPKVQEIRLLSLRNVSTFLDRISSPHLLACSAMLAGSPKRAPEGAMVELNGIEPLTPCLQSRCSPS